jgi:hypothetical protein
MHAPPTAVAESGDADDFGDLLLDGPKDGADAPKAPKGLEERKKKLRQLKGKKKLTSAEYEAARELAAGIADAEPAQQAEWLWRSFSQASSASFLEREGLTGELSTAHCLLRPSARWEPSRQRGRPPTPQAPASPSCPATAAWRSG